MTVILQHDRVRSLSKRERRKLSKRAPLEHALHVAGISTLNRESVKAFKREKLEELHRPLFGRRKIWCPNLKVAWGGMGLVLLVLSLVELGIMATWGRYFGALLLLGLVPHLREEREIEYVVKTPQHQARWEVLPLEDYAARCLERFSNLAAVPAAANDILKEVRARLPQMQPYVHYLYEDPFLELVLDKERFFVFHWDHSQDAGFSP